MNTNEPTENLLENKSSRKILPVLLIVAVIIILIVLGLVVWNLFKGGNQSSEMYGYSLDNDKYKIGNSPANSSNYGFIVESGDGFWIANFNKAGTIAKLNNNLEVESTIELNDNLSVYDLNLYNGFLYFVGFKPSDKGTVSTLYRINLADQDNVESLVEFESEMGFLTIPIIFDDSIFLYHEDSYGMAGVDNQLYKYELDGTLVMEKPSYTPISSITTNGQYLFGKTGNPIYKITPDFNETQIFSFDGESPTSGEFFYSGGRLYFLARSYVQGEDSKTSIESVSIDGTNLKTDAYGLVSSNTYSAQKHSQIAFTVYNDKIYAMTDMDKGYIIYKIDVQSSQREELVRVEDSYPDSALKDPIGAAKIFIMATPKGLITLRTYEGQSTGIYGFIDYDGNYKYLGDYTGLDTEFVKVY